MVIRPVKYSKNYELKVLKETQVHMHAFFVSELSPIKLKGALACVSIQAFLRLRRKKENLNWILLCRNVTYYFKYSEAYEKALGF